MKSILIKEKGIFMTKLLTQDCFDEFLTEEVKITTSISFSLNGRLHRDFFNEEEKALMSPEEFTSWAGIKGLCYEIFKGKNMPLSFSIILRSPRALTDQILKDCSDTLKDSISSLMLCIRFDGRDINCITGCSLSSFVADRSAENAWDKWCVGFLLKNFPASEPQEP